MRAQQHHVPLFGEHHDRRRRSAAGIISAKPMSRLSTRPSFETIPMSSIIRAPRAPYCFLSVTPASVCDANTCVAVRGGVNVSVPVIAVAVESVPENDNVP